MSTAKQERPRSALSVWLPWVISVAVGVWGVLTQIDNTNLSRQITDMQQRAVALDARLVGGDLILKAEGGEFVEPDFLTVQPRFTNASNDLIAGDEIEINVDAGFPQDGGDSIIYTQIKERLCQRPQIVELCTSQEYQMTGIVVRYSVGGLLDKNHLDLPL